jgi:hypothetical protein
MATELMARFYQMNYRGQVFSSGMTLTAINNATYTSATLGATETPIVGVWNPSTNGVNLVILQASLTIVTTALSTPTGGAPFVWAVSTGNAGLSAVGLLTPWNRKTLVQSGSSAKGLANVALTGLTTTLVVMEGADCQGGPQINVTAAQTAAGFSTQAQAGIQNFDGSLIVPPGGILSLLATTTPVACSAASRIMWAEIPV